MLKWAQPAQVAQLVEHFPEEEGVASSSLALGTLFQILLPSQFLR